MSKSSPQAKQLVTITYQALSVGNQIYSSHYAYTKTKSGFLKKVPGSIF